jgi:hypothetical protein
MRVYLCMRSRTEAVVQSSMAAMRSSRTPMSSSTAAISSVMSFSSAEATQCAFGAAACQGFHGIHHAECAEEPRPFVGLQKPLGVRRGEAIGIDRENSDEKSILRPFRLVQKPDRSGMDERKRPERDGNAIATGGAGSQ